MKRYQIFVLIVFLSLFIGSCSEDIDDVKPEIDLSFAGAFPVNCDTLYFGETFNFVARLTDNVELGSITALSIDIHNNFNHHSHSTEVTECSLDDIKEPVNPFLVIQSYDIPEGLASYETGLEITIPSGDNNGDFDEGDYHFFISVTDKEGWSAQKGLSIKILRRE